MEYFVSRRSFRNVLSLLILPWMLQKLNLIGIYFYETWRHIPQRDPFSIFVYSVVYNTYTWPVSSDSLAVYCIRYTILAQL